MKNFSIIVIFLIFALFFIYNFINIRSISKIIKQKELEIIGLFFGKINKIPALVEIMKKYIKQADIFEDIIYLHKLGIIYNIESIYDLLDINSKIHKEFIFLMKLSTKIPELQRDGNFLYIRNYMIFYEKNIEKEIEQIDILIRKHNKLRKIKKYSIFGILFPIEEKIEF